MKKTLYFVFLFIAIGIKTNAQVLSISDTIKELSFFSIKSSGDTIRRSSTRYSPLDESVNQNFKNLRFEKVKVNDENFYVLTYQKTSVVKFDVESYVTLAIEFERKNTSQYENLNDSYYFALTEKQYHELKNLITNGTGKILKIKSKIHGEPYVGLNSIKYSLKNQYKVEHIFTISAFNDEINFRLPETYYNIKLTKKLFKNHHFICDKKTFEKLLAI